MRTTTFITVAASLLLLHIIHFIRATTTTSLQNQAQRRTISPASLSPLVVTNQFASVQRVKASGKRSSRHYTSAHKGYGTNKLRDIEVEEEWAMEIGFGQEKALVIIDTGSSDTWIVQKGFQCVSATMKARPENKCAFGPVFNGSFPVSSRINNTNSIITYGDGEFLTGTFGYETLTLAGIKLQNQEVALVNKAFWEGDGVTSGLLGLAYDALTSAYVGTNPTIDNENVTGLSPGDVTIYSAVMHSLITQSLIEAPILSLALQRSDRAIYNSAGGYVAFGGLPPVSFDPVFATASIEILNPPFSPVTANNYTFYTIVPDGYVYANKRGSGHTVLHKTTGQVIVDSGTTLMYVPSAVVAAYYATFSPPPVTYEGAPFAPCNSTAPYFGVKIGGTVFNVSSADIILPDSGYVNQTSGVEYCLIGIVDEALDDDFLILGDVFLKNVVAVFDIGANVMRFAAHSY